MYWEILIGKKILQNLLNFKKFAAIKGRGIEVWLTVCGHKIIEQINVYCCFD